VTQIIWFSREIANAEELPSNYFTQGKMVIDPSNPERFSISFSNNHPSRALHCRDFSFISGAAELSFCSDPNSVGPVTSKLPNFTIDSKARTMLADLGADAVEGYKLANGLALTSQINLCDGIPTQKSGMCEFGCGPAAREQSGKCIRICANGLDYGTTKSGRFACYYRTMTCSKEGEMSCTETYRPGPGCPMIEDPGPHFCNDDWK
jgi:hypothetical protein